MRGRSRYILFLLLLIPVFVFAQKSKSQLEKEKKQNLKKIQQTSKILNETQSQKKATLGQLSAVNQKVKDQQNLVKTIKREVKVYDVDIEENQLLIISLQGDLDTLKAEYAAMLYAASKTQNGYDKLLFIFSSSSLNEMMMRLKYMEQYTDARKVQVEQILRVQETLNEQNEELKEKRAIKEELLNSMLKESQNLIALKTQKKSIFNELTNREKELKKELKENEKAVRKLEKLIEDLVKAELAKSVKKDSKGVSKMKLTPEAAILSNSFAENKGRLLWPVEYGFVSQKFGKHAHPVIAGVMVDNLGVDIQTKKSSNVRVVFDGVVTAVAEVPGMNRVVMVQHGEYFTVYAKVTNVKVKMGQKLKAKDIIGTVYTNHDGLSEIQFQVWKTSQKQNPQSWLYKR